MPMPSLIIEGPICVPFRAIQGIVWQLSRNRPGTVQGTCLAIVWRCAQLQGT